MASANREHCSEKSSQVRSMAKVVAQCAWNSCRWALAVVGSWISNESSASGKLGGSGRLVGGMSFSWRCGTGGCGSTGLGGRGGWEGMPWVSSSDSSSARAFRRFSRLVWCSRAGEDWWTGGVAGGENTGDFGSRFGRQVRRRYLIISSICLSGFGQIVAWLCSGMGGAMSGDGDLDGGVVMWGVASGLDAGDLRSGVFGVKSRH